MLNVLVLSLAALVPSWDEADASPRSAQLELVARLGETRMSAHNPGERPQLLIVGEVDGDARARTWLAPGASLETRFPPGSLDGLALEVVSFGPGGVTSSGALALAELAAAGFDAVWIETSSLGSQTWGRSGALTSALSASSLGLSGLSANAPRPAPPKPVHVPVVTPADRRNGDVPPRLEKKPLPPL
jgi:hypothetical protein